MLFLAIPMYAAPFVLISLVLFAVFLAIARLRRFAIAALVAPIAFGGCAAVALLGWVLVCAVFKIDLKPVTGARGELEGLAFFIVPGVLGSWAAVWIANKSVWAWRRLPIAPSWKERTSPAEAVFSGTIGRHG